MMKIIAIIIYFLMLITSHALDTILANQTIADGDSIVSRNGTFELGFFSPGNSKNRYLGIWFKNIIPRTVIWVANRANPISSTSGVFMFNKKRMVLFQNRSIIWSFDFSIPVTVGITDTTTVAQLKDSGNFVIKGRSNEDFIWQSFDYPGNTFLPGMKFGKNFRTGKDRYLTSWRSPDDPSLGEYALKWFMDGYPQVYKMKGSIIESRLGPWNGDNYAGLPSYSQNQITTYKMEIITNEEETYYLYSLNSTTVLERAILTADGRVEFSHHDRDSKAQIWMQDWTMPLDNCDNYGMCGPYGSCNTLTSPYCKCLNEFKPAEEWRPDNWASGCQRMVALECKPKEGFLKFPGLKLPDTQGAWFNENMTLEECAASCKDNCSCTAYANPYIAEARTGCLLWFGDLLDIRVYPQRGQDLYVRMDASELFYHCRSLEKIGDLSNKYKWLFQISLHCCPKLLKDQESKSHLANLLSKSLVQKCSLVNHQLSILVPGTKIPNWFRNQRSGNMIPLKLPPNQVTNGNMIGLAICCLFSPPWTETGAYLKIKFKAVGEERLIDQRYVGKGADRVWIGYMSIEFLQNLFHGFETDLAIILESSIHYPLQCGVEVIYKNDLKQMTADGPWIPDYDELQHERWSLPTFSFDQDHNTASVLL